MPIHDQVVNLPSGNDMRVLCGPVEKKLNRMPGCDRRGQLRAGDRPSTCQPGRERGPDHRRGPDRDRRGNRLAPPPCPNRRLLPTRTPPTVNRNPRSWRPGQRLVISTVLTIPVVLMAMIPALQFPNWQWLSLTLTARSWSGVPGLPPCRVDQPPPWRGHDGHLISLGVSAAFIWSLYAPSSATRAWLG